MHAQAQYAGHLDTLQHSSSTPATVGGAEGDPAEAHDGENKADGRKRRSREEKAAVAELEADTRDM